MQTQAAPFVPKGRAQLSQVLRRAGEVVSVDDVSSILQVERQAATKLLARWSEQGWMRRLRRGFYAPVPLASLGQEQVLEDPWVIVPDLFGPACIGGWSAAEHWGLTEQLFRSICVLTARPIREKEQTIEGIPFVVKHVRPETLFASRAVWRGRMRIDVSGPAKTVLKTTPTNAGSSSYGPSSPLPNEPSCSPNWMVWRGIDWMTRKSGRPNAAAIKALSIIMWE